MRKYLTGTLFGFTLAFAFGVQAQDIIPSLVGKTVEGQFPVKINGKSLDNQAAVMDGSGYLPVRAIGDALNMEVIFDSNSGIELNDKGGNVVTTPRRQTIFPDNQSSPKLDKLTIEEIEKQIEAIKSQQMTYNNFLKIEEDNLQRNLKPETMEEVKNYVTKYRAELDKLRSELADLENQKAELSK